MSIKHFIIAGLLLGCIITGSVLAPVIPQPAYLTYRVRITAYSPKQPRENHKTATGKSARNERGAATHKSFLPLGTMIILPDGSSRIIDDRIPYRSAKRFNLLVVDVRYYQSIDAKSKTKAVNRELKREYDKGYGYIKVIK